MARRKLRHPVAEGVDRDASPVFALNFLIQREIRPDRLQQKQIRLARSADDDRGVGRRDQTAGALHGAPRVKAIQHAGHFRAVGELVASLFENRAENDRRIRERILTDEKPCNAVVHRYDDIRLDGLVFGQHQIQQFLPFFVLLQPVKVQVLAVDSGRLTQIGLDPLANPALPLLVNWQLSPLAVQNQDAWGIGRAGGDTVQTDDPSQE
jgi:hypothetical protein